MPKIDIKETVFLGCVVILMLISTFVLRSIAPFLYPEYFLYIFGAFLIFILLRLFDFEILRVFSVHLYVVSIILLIIPLVIGQVTRGVIRWIPIGSLSLQPSEIVRPFLILFFSYYLTRQEITWVRLLKSFIFFIIPFFLILIQPSLGVAFLTGTSFLGVFLSSPMDKKKKLSIIFSLFLIAPLVFLFLAPYQKERITSFISPLNDPSGAGYNSIQSMISVGSGGFLGRGLGEGVQTQLEFLPEKHTDFIFAALSEEMGFVGSFLIVSLYFVIFYIIISFIKESRSLISRAFISGVFMVFLSETVVHMGMNLGLLPITGVPLPFMSAGGSSLIGSFMMISILIKAKNH